MKKAATTKGGSGIMPDCEYIGECIMHQVNRATQSVPVSVYADSYCHGDCTRCAIYMLMKAHQPVQIPVTLLPHERRKARRLIRAA